MCLHVRGGAATEMHIVFFTINMDKGGTERVISNLCNEYLVKKYRVSIVTYLTLSCHYELDKDIRLYSLGIKQKGSAAEKLLEMPFARKKYMELMSRIKPDVVLAFLPRPCLLACSMKRKLKVPVIGAIRSNPARNFQNLVYRFLAKQVLAKADGFVFQTKDARMFFTPRLQKKSVIIMNPINTEAIREPYRGDRSRRIVSVGRFTDEKNFPLLVRAFAGLDKEYADYELWIYGKYNEKLRIKEMAEALGVAERVVFAGESDRVYDEIYDASLFVLSSKSEGMPNALMEAMAMGLPVIATDCPCGGPRQLIRHGENGMLVPNEDEEALTRAMEEMLSDKERAGCMGEKALLVGIRYSGEKVYGKWEQYLLHVIKRTVSK